MQMANDSGLTAPTGGDLDVDDVRFAGIVGEGELDSSKVLDRSILYAFEQGSEKLRQADGFSPFLILLKGEELFIEEQPSLSEAECYAAARRTIFQMDKICTSYIFCYDGFVTLEDGDNDALVVEYASRDDLEAQVIVRLYHQHDGHYHFDDGLYAVGEAESLFVAAGDGGDAAGSAGGASGAGGAGGGQDGDAAGSAGGAEGAGGSQGEPEDAAAAAACACQTDTAAAAACACQTDAAAAVECACQTDAPAASTAATGEGGDCGCKAGRP
jgi:hypothetical protein